MRLLQYLAVTASLGLVSQAAAADHTDGPGVQAAPEADINDLYAFVSPGDDSKLVFIMTVNPFSGLDAVPSDAVDYSFHVQSLATGAWKTVRCWYDGTNFACDAGDGVRAEGAYGERVNGDSISVWAGVADDPFFFDLAAFGNVGEVDDNGDPVQPQFCLLNPERVAEDALAGANVIGITVEISKEVFVAGQDDQRIAVFATTARRGG